ncbi:Eco57I restriction-modification methylase domain-containing protein [Umezakia ovalisporum]|uniref:Eco57I restriction-modification methylase domain-containing protein n=1 Tax=Umezakia ovalisporum TaxID=75695 RepID=UPI0035B85F31
MINTQQLIDHYAWWSSLKHGGLLISPAKLAEFFIEDIEPLPIYLEDRLRRDVTRFRNGEQEHINKLLNTVLEDILELVPDWWTKASAIDSHWSQKAITGEIIKPRRIWQDPNGTVLPVFVPEEIVSRLGVGRGRRSVTRVVEWLRKANQKIALLTNGRQWRLIHAGTDYDAWCEWDIDLWFTEGKPGLQVQALRSLLGKKSLQSEKPDTPSFLIAAIQASRQGQAELSDVLGERVRKAVELLIKESSPAIAPLELVTENPISRRDIYIAATRLIMRCVVILFAEARDLLDRTNQVYYSSYSISGLREQLERLSGGKAGERLRNTYNAWPRLLSLFRLVYVGCAHPELPIPRYGGGLFTPGDTDARDSIVRALAAFENPSHTPSDAAVYRILELLCRSKVKIRQGRSSTWVEAPVDFSDLSSEYIGILYEGLLDFELRRAGEDEPILFLNLGNQPALPLTRLEAMDDKALAVLVEKLKQKNQSASGEDDEETGEDLEENTAQENNTDPTDEIPEDEEIETVSQETDTAQQLRQRAYRWGERAVKAGKLVAKAKSKKAEAVAEYEKNVIKAAGNLIARIILPGEWFLVRWGGTRKGSGTFYTRPQLAVPTAWRTLLPLVYVGVGEVGEVDDCEGVYALSMSLSSVAEPLNNIDIDFESSSSSVVNKGLGLDEWIPREPEEILSLKICDPACGSASFLIAALRFIADGLWKSLFYHRWLGEHENNEKIQVILSEDVRPEWFKDCVKDLPVTVEKAENYIRAKLKRYVVERCIYGVEINPLAVELARLSLWVETMDRNLPFSFLDHKVKCGNALVGCWFDRFQDYPAMAWEREAGDKNHQGFVHHFREYVDKKKGQIKKSGDKWTQAIKDTKNDIVKAELKNLLETLDPSKKQLTYPNFDLPKLPENIHDEALNIFEELHNVPVYDTEEKETKYRDLIENSDAIRRLKLAFDTWCAVWFWPGEHIDSAPTPGKFFNPPAETKVIITRLASEYQFFHWELEFPDVFATANSGFHGIIGNPPWEIQKPNSQEFFSNVDPLYRAYGKQEAVNKQLAYFQQDPKIEQNWLKYCDRLKALSNWNKYVAFPFGDEKEGGDKFSLSKSKVENKNLHHYWRSQRHQRRSYTEGKHPFQYQGSADINTYKMFLELSLALLRDKGRMGMIVPSGIYTDKGATDLRSQFLSNCQWELIFGIINWNKIFQSVYYRFKFCVLILQKGDKTVNLNAAFSRYNISEWEEAEKYLMKYSSHQVTKFSPKSKAILEIRSQRDLQVLEKIYSHGVLLGDDSPQGWGIKYATEFHMTNDSKLFPPRHQWEAKGYCPDEYGHWLKGNWQNYDGDAAILNRPQGLILSVDGKNAIHVNDVEDVALPLYEGRMIGQFDFSQKGWVSGKGRTAVWRDIPFENKIVEPQYLMSIDDCISTVDLGVKIPIMNIGSSTNARTIIGVVTRDFPCNHSLNPMRVLKLEKAIVLASILNSILFDYNLRARLGGLNISFFVLDETAIIAPENNLLQSLLRYSASLSMISRLFSRDWLYLKNEFFQEECKKYPLKGFWAITVYERLRIRCIIDALIAEFYGISWDDFAWILYNCDQPKHILNNSDFYRTLDPKGFWRVDKEKDPELRHTVLSLVAFHELKKIGLEAFLNLNNGEGWMLPDTLRLADYQLGQDHRAQEPQPVAARLGERYLPWQLEGTIEESWQECEKHAENLRKLLQLPQPPPTDTPPTTTLLPSDPNYQPPTDLFGNPLPVDLFGNVVENKAKRKQSKK